jgi:hypothetical protein
MRFGKCLQSVSPFEDYSPMAHNNEIEKKKGRPKSSESKHFHFTVWVSETQKKELQKNIQSTGLSASEYFLHLALKNRLKLPKRKGLPFTIQRQIQLLEKLSGVLTLAAIKTKDKEMVSNEWLESSANIKQISILLLLWIFEDFDLPAYRNLLQTIEKELQEVMIQLSKQFPEAELITQVQWLINRTKLTMNKYESYFQFEFFDRETWQKMSWQNENVHQHIKEVLDKIKAMK